MSKSCHREVYASVRSGRPTIILYEGDDNTVKKMKECCLARCNVEEGLSGDDILGHILVEDALLWLGASSRYFAIASVKELSLKILKRLPYHQRNVQDLPSGLKFNDYLFL